MVKSEKQAEACHLYQQTYWRGYALGTLTVQHRVLTSNTLYLAFKIRKLLPLRPIQNPCNRRK